MKKIECIKDRHGALIPIDKIKYISQDCWVSIGGDRKDISGTTLKYLRCIFKEINIENAIQEKPADKVVWHDSIDELKESEDEILCKEIKQFIRSRGMQLAQSKVESWIAWLEKQGEQKQEWSEDDKRKIDRIYSILLQAADTRAFSTSCRLISDKECIELQDFLKSLRPQNRWKPSEEQMKALSNALSLAKNCGEECAFELNQLQDQLKKLREEDV